jgi:RecQ-mediated genome instability protein 1
MRRLASSPGGPVLAACFAYFNISAAAGADPITTMASSEQIAAQILNTKSLSVSQSWLNTLLTNSNSAQRNIPASALTKTALFRVLASDFRESLTTSPSTVLPVDIIDPTVQERRLQGPIPVQVLDIEDIGTSLWSQVEAIERVERGEAIRGREVVRTIPISDDNEGADNANGRTNNQAAPNASGSSGYGPHRLILQDSAGTKTVAIEMKPIEGISLEKLSIGAKLVLQNTTVARGMVLLNPGCVTLLGGKIDALDRPWKEDRKKRLLERISTLQGT